jgi:hypothetical protein
MKHIKHILIIAIWGAGIQTCSGGYSQESSVQYAEFVVRVDSVIVNTVSGSEVNFSVFCTVGDPCWEFASASSHFDEDNIYTSISARRNKESICAQVISVLKSNITIAVKSSGATFFHFWQDDNQYLTIKVEMP